MHVAHETVRTFEQLQSIPKTTISGYILSGSTEHVHEISFDKYLMNVAAIESGVPVLGICFGAQFMHVYHGGQLIDQLKTTCKDMRVCMHDSNECFVAKFCNRYTMDSTAEGFATHASYMIGADKHICMIKHKKKPLWGVLFHPEDHIHTHRFIQAFVNTCH